jgi:hypothetical protein
LVVALIKINNANVVFAGKFAQKVQFSKKMPGINGALLLPSQLASSLQRETAKSGGYIQD